MGLDHNNVENMSASHISYPFHNWMALWKNGAQRINVILWTSDDIWVVVHDNLELKNQHVVIGFGELAAVE